MESSLTVSDDICLTATVDILRAISSGRGPRHALMALGYSGWGAGQVEKELEEGSWIVANVTAELIFETDPNMLWKRAIESLGSEFSYLVNMPINPQLN